MSTAEIFVEQLLIGSLVLAMLALPLAENVSLPPSGDSIAIVATVFAGVAYLLGIVGDRIADTLCEGLEGRQRIQFAVETLRRTARTHLSPKVCVDDALVGGGWAPDPFPEGRMRLAIDLEGGTPAEHLAYLRSRIRLARGMLVFVPGVAFAAMCTRIIGYTPVLVGAGPRALVGLCAVYVAGLLVAWRSERKHERIPRTDQVGEVIDYARSRRLLCDCPKSSCTRTMRHIARAYLVEPVVVTSVLLLASSLAIASVHCPDNARRRVIALGATLLTFLAGWTWWRVNKTFRQYLLDFSDAKRRSR